MTTPTNHEIGAMHRDISEIFPDYGREIQRSDVESIWQILNQLDPVSARELVKEPAAVATEEMFQKFVAGNVFVYRELRVAQAANRFEGKGLGWTSHDKRDPVT